ncbi:MAG: endosialidase [Clostridiales bacterium]|nr:endosialidase [Clostridiales bacterium]
MAVIEELIRVEEDGSLSFGNYLMDEKKKVLDFDVDGDLYKVKTFRDMTRLEKNGKMVLESNPGTTVHHFVMTDKKVSFLLESAEDAEITLELEPEKEYKVLVDDVNVGKMKSNIAGKITFSVEISAGSVAVFIEKVF